jgi:catechol 2,3-dioxygenase-like lactoylglutathione lyase family enzyme
MFSHVMLGADDMDAAKRFYDAVLGTLGVGAGTRDDKGRLWYQTQRGTFAITRPINGEPASCANGGTIGFLARTPEAVHAWHEAGIANGGTSCEDPPGERSNPFGRLYLAYLRDPAGNKICALHRIAAPGEGNA